jgi:hypothetical protein
MKVDRDSCDHIVMRLSVQEAERIRIALEDFTKVVWNVTERPHIVRTAKEAEAALDKMISSGKFP